MGTRKFLVLSLMLSGCPVTQETLASQPATLEKMAGREQFETLAWRKSHNEQEPLTHADASAMPLEVSNYSSYRKYYVSLSGSDAYNGTQEKPFATVGYALERAGDGSVIFVQEGKYPIRTLSITHSNFVLRGHPGENVEFLPAGGDGTAIVIQGDVHDVVVAGLSIEGFETGIIYGDSSTQENLIFKDLVIKNAEIGIENTYIRHTAYLVDGLLVKDVAMKDITGIGLQCGDEQNKCAKNVLVRDVVIEGARGLDNDTGYDSLAMVNSDNVIVMNSQFSNAPGDGLDFKATRVSVVNTIVSNPNRNGMKFWNDGEVLSCKISETGADAAIVFDAPESGGLGFRMVNSVVEKHAVGERAYAMTFNYDTRKSSPITFKNNVVKDMSGPVFVNKGSFLVMENNAFSNFDGAFLVFGDKEYESASDLNAESWASGNSYSD